MRNVYQKRTNFRIVSHSPPSTLAKLAMSTRIGLDVLYQPVSGSPPSGRLMVFCRPLRSTDSFEPSVRSDIEPQFTFGARVDETTMSPDEVVEGI